MLQVSVVDAPRYFDWKEMLAVAVAADDIRTMLRHALPEEARNVVVALLPCQFVFAGCAYGFRYLSVCVQAVERIFAAGQRVKDGPVVEFLRHAQVLRIAGDGVQVCQHLVHAAEFGIERGLLLLIAQTVDAELDPIGLIRRCLVQVVDQLAAVVWHLCCTVAFWIIYQHKVTVLDLSEVVIEERGHIYNFEMATMSAFAGTIARPVKSNDGSGILTWDEIAGALRFNSAYYVAPTGLIVLRPYIRVPEAGRDDSV